MVFLAEHHVLYQYNLVGAKDHYMGLIQTETVRASMGFSTLSSNTFIRHTFSPTQRPLLHSLLVPISTIQLIPMARQWLGQSE